MMPARGLIGLAYGMGPVSGYQNTAADPGSTGNPYGETPADYGKLRQSDVDAMSQALPPDTAAMQDVDPNAGHAGSSHLGRRPGYDPNDVRGGFEANGDSSAYHPRSYDPREASKLLFSLAAAGEPAARSLLTRLEMGGLGTEELLAIVKSGTPAFRKVFGSDIEGALAGLKKPVYDSGLTREQANAYREQIARKLPEYEANDNHQALTLQDLRYRILDSIGK